MPSVARNGTTSRVSHNRPFAAVGDTRAAPSAAAGPLLYSLVARPAVRSYRRNGSFNMSKEPTLYDLVLLLTMSADEDTRTKLVADAEAMIAAAGGSVTLKQAWGQRPTTYKIDHQAEADYYLLQFTGSTSLLESLSHTLRIADTVLRFRIIKVVPGTPDAPESAPPVLAGATGVTAAAETEAA